MKNIVLSTVAVLAMSSFAVAGGDIAPVEEPIVVVEPVVDDSGFYLGLAYGLLNFDFTEREVFDGKVIYEDSKDEDFNEIMLQAGYKFNSYVAIEGRYWFGLDETFTDTEGDITYDYDVSVDAWGIYVKPMYPVTDAFDIYALLGYAEVECECDGDTESIGDGGLSWGIGAAYSFNDNVSLFVDYVSLYDDTETTGLFEEENTISTWNFGVTYQF